MADDESPDDDGRDALSLVPDLYEQLGDLADRFVAAWERTHRPPLADYVPESGPLRQLALVELIKIDLEFNWIGAGDPRYIDDYLREFPELAREGIPSDLIYEEFHLRREAGLQVDPTEYLERFPENAAQLRRLMSLDEPTSTTSMMQGRKHELLSRLQPGDTIDDFQLLTLLGKGSFASVYLARQNSMQRLVALKVSADSGNEPQTLAQLDHDYIVRVFDLRVDRQRQLRLLYMQYVSGGTLAAVLERVRITPLPERTGQILVETVRLSLERRGETPPAESQTTATLATQPWFETVCWIGSRLAEGLDYAHRRGVLHRDVKPANVLLTGEGVPKLADFNISFSSKVSGATPAAYFGGSLAYMSPEQLEACNPAHARQPDSLDGRSDVYSLAVMLWELLTGQRPFADEPVSSGGWGRTLAAMVERRREPLEQVTHSNLPPGCPPGLVHVLSVALACHPEDRWQRGAEFSRQLDLCSQPRARDLLYPDSRSSCSRLTGIAVPLMVLAAAIPNILAGIFNYHYNKEEIVRHLGDLQPAFWQTQAIINSIFYPAGLGLLAWLGWSVADILRRMRSGEPVSTEVIATARSRSLSLGHLSAWIGVVLWCIAGVAYPVSIHLAAGSMPASGYMHFFGSLLICGLVAAAYPFFAVTWLNLRMTWRCLVYDQLSAIDDRPRLEKLRKQAWFYFRVALLMPLLGISTLLAMGSEARVALAVFTAGGVLGVLALYPLCREMQDDLTALIEATGKRM
ncbi:MAG: serine/threonine protein kinase [Planctomycetaceae bacterium]|nr:serine/threonine protein kinase [Planctomycetaceae bacterium]